MRRRDFVAAVAGLAVGWPRGANAQPQKMPVIGFLTVTPVGSREAAFRRALREAGFIEGQNLVIEYHPVEGQYRRLPAMAAELIARKVDLIAAGGPPAARAAKDATATIPVVFVIGGDPVKEGFVASLARPGGNVTGISILARDLAAKRLQLVIELVPATKRIVLLANLNNAAEETLVGDMQQAARETGLQLDIVNAGTETELDAAFAKLAEAHSGAPPGVLIVGNDSFFNIRRQQIIALALRAGIPAIYRSRDFPDAGGLISYGPDITAAWHEAGIYAGKILNGAKPADLPVQQPDKFELVINLKTAKALGLTVPQSLLAGADEVIE